MASGKSLDSHVDLFLTLMPYAHQLMMASLSLVRIAKVSRTMSG
jgi:hypothetical protein